ncbi:MAG: molecular chaperone [Aliiglaciecola sp.]|uniref:molecular chaperone n=1 Tax=Aliiglaciecola sp. TaxID=1872441 RepID=UPI0032987EBA
MKLNSKDRENKMFAGLDFGTSNCSIGIIEQNEPVLIPLEDGETTIPSCVFLEHGVIKPEKVSETDLLARVKAEKAAQTQRAKSETDARVFTDAELINIFRKVIRAENREDAKTNQRMQTVMEALALSDDIIIGREAELAHIINPENGFYIKSPKSFLGAKITKAQQGIFASVIEKMLAFIKEESEYIKGIELESVVIGRPVNFHGLQEKDGNSQALSILTSAAKKVGFKDIEFLMEPLAAAYDYERQLSQDKVVLIIDLGGGTTDCSVVKLGPSYINSDIRESNILGCSGKRIGGIDIDNKLALMGIMPHFGKDIILTNDLPIPPTLFRQAVCVNDVAAQREFNSNRTGVELQRYCYMSLDNRIERLKKLRDDKLGLKLNKSSELTKIALSTKNLTEVNLDYIESNLQISVSRDQLGDAISGELKQIESIVNESLLQSGAKPDTIFVTGGTAISPVIKQWISSMFPDTEIVIGNHFGSVTSGLITHAQRIFGN